MVECDLSTVQYALRRRFRRALGLAALPSGHAAATACCLAGGSLKPRMPSVPLNFISASYRYLTIPMDGATCILRTQCHI